MLETMESGKRPWAILAAVAALVLLGLEAAGYDALGGMTRLLAGSTLLLIVAGFLVGRFLDRAVARRTSRQGAAE